MCSMSKLLLEKLLSEPMELLDIVLRDAPHVLQVIGIVEVLKLNSGLQYSLPAFASDCMAPKIHPQCGLVHAM